MGKIRGQGANSVSRRSLLDRMKAKFRRHPIAPTTAPDNTNAISSLVRATNSTLSNSPPVPAHAVDELPQPSTATVSSKPSSDDNDLVQPSSTVLVVDAGDKPLSDCSSKFPEGSSVWEKAYNAANPETKKWIDGFLAPNSISKSADSIQTEELIEIVRNVEKRHQDHALRIRIGEKQILWKDYAPRVISFIKAIGDIAIQFAPAPSGIIWSALKTLLQMSIAPGEEFAAILGCSEKVLSIVRRGKVYEVIYLSHANTLAPVQEVLERSLVDVYTKSLELLAHVGQRLAGEYRYILLAIISPGAAEVLMASLIESENNLITAAQACEVVRSADADEHLNTLLNSLSEPLTQINDKMGDLLEEAEEHELLNALESFSRIDFGDQHRIRAESRTPGTGEWLLQHRKFQEWEQVPASTILWLQGTVGMGKSFLASKVIDRFRLKAGVNYHHESQDDQGLAFFYCSRGQADLQDPLSTLQSFVRQLSTSPRYSKMMKKSLIKLYRENRKNGLKLGFDACKEQLLESVNLYPQTIVILDGLDECDATSRGKLITILANLVNDAQHPVKIFISSRREQDIVKLLPAGSIIEIDVNDNRNDIEKFIEEKMEEIEGGGLWESIPKELKSEIKSTLCKGSDGMFRWAFLQMEQLSKCQQAKEIRDRLGKLPMSLNASYHELFTGMSSHSQETLRRAVLWVMCAYEPLSSNQLLSAVRLSMNDDAESHDIEEELTEETLRSICRHLVVTDAKRGKWKFPHASVIEYFETVHGWKMADAHCFVAKHSLICLINGYSKWELPAILIDEKHPSNKRDQSNKRDPQYPAGHLQQYVREYWFRHVHALEGLQSHDAQLSLLVKRFMGFNNTLQQSSHQYSCWIQHEQDKHNNDRFTILFQDVSPSINPVFGACAFGFYHVVQDWWQAGVDISQVNAEGRDLLAIAAKHGHQHLCEKLIGFGADVNRVLRGGEISPLFEAARADHAGVVQLLLDNNADPNLPLDKPILCLSVRRHDLAIARALLEAGANPDVHWSFASVLEEAGFYANDELVALLIQYKSTVNLYTKGDFGSPLAAAAWGGSIEIVRLLIEHGADVNAPLKYGKYGSALAAGGVGISRVQMIKYLIEEAGADPNILSTNPPPIPPEVYLAYEAYESGRYLKENGYVVDEDVLRKVSMWPLVEESEI
ncbi:hypothetical protein Trisim1_008639 [Trichoderma cf. simile WF8]